MGVSCHKHLKETLIITYDVVAPVFLDKEHDRKHRYEIQDIIYRKTPARKDQMIASPYLGISLQKYLH